MVLGVVIYSLINASKIQIKNIEVKINNLPTAWQNKKIVEISDLHLGPWYDKNFVYKIVDLINQQEPQAVFIVGDYFDGMKLKSADFAEPLKVINAYNGVYAVIGNHDYMFGADETEKQLTNNNVQVLRDDIISVQGLEIIGAEYRGPEASNERTYLPVLAKHQASPSIMLAHEPVLIDEVRDAKIDLLLCGHTHKGQLWPFTYLPMYFFQRFTYGLQQAGDLQIYTSSGVGTWGPPMRVGSKSEIVVITLK